MNILLVDDHPVFRAGIAALLKSLFSGADIEEVGNSADLRRALTTKKAWDLVLLDLLFPGFDAEKDFPQLRKTVMLTPIVVVSMAQDKSIIHNLMAHGANGFVSKSARPEDMSRAFLSIMDGETVSLYGSINQIDMNMDGAVSALKPRQIDILKQVAQGLSNKEIAGELEISPYTVRIHVSALLKSLNLTNRAAIASYAASRGLL